MITKNGNAVAAAQNLNTIAQLPMESASLNQSAVKLTDTSVMEPTKSLTSVFLKTRIITTQSAVLQVSYGVTVLSNVPQMNSVAIKHGAPYSTNASQIQKLSVKIVSQETLTKSTASPTKSALPSTSSALFAVTHPTKSTLKMNLETMLVKTTYVNALTPLIDALILANSMFAKNAAYPIMFAHTLVNVYLLPNFAAMNQTPSMNVIMELMKSLPELNVLRNVAYVQLPSTLLRLIAAMTAPTETNTSANLAHKLELAKDVANQKLHAQQNTFQVSNSWETTLL
jgi:hypothetical protein